MLWDLQVCFDCRDGQVCPIPIRVCVYTLPHTCQLLYLTNTHEPREILLTINGQKKMLCLKKYGTIRGLGLLD